MKEREFDAQDLMEWERLQGKFVKGIPTIEEIDAAINALKVVANLNSQIEKLEKNCLVYEQQLNELLEKRRNMGQKKNRKENDETEEQEPKKKNPYLKIWIISFIITIVLLIIMIQITGLKYLELVHGVGSVIVCVGIAIGVAGITVAIKEKRIKKERERRLNKSLVKVQLKLDSTQEDIKNIEESSQKVTQKVHNLLEKYGFSVEKEGYIESLFELRREIELYNELEIRRS